MSAHHSTWRLARAARQSRRVTNAYDLCSCFNQLQVSQSRFFHLSQSRNSAPSLNPERKTPQAPAAHFQKGNATPLPDPNLSSKPNHLKLTPEQRAAAAAKRARQKLKEQEETVRSNQRYGSLAGNSLFAEDETPLSEAQAEDDKALAERPSDGFSQRSLTNMSIALNPRPNARARWQRRMVIRHIRHGGRLTKQMKISRTERSHLSRSHFFKTSMKKLAPLARQIAGKSIDEAILQMRFSKKKVAQDVRDHLIQARNEAIVVKGMGLRAQSEEQGQNSTKGISSDPAVSPPLAHQNPTKSNKRGHSPQETDIYVAEAWTNRGQYGKAPDYRARGQVYMLRPPHTGISILLKEEKTRTRVKLEKEAKQIRKRMGKNMWTQLPDRKITNQSQYVLW